MARGKKPTHDEVWSASAGRRGGGVTRDRKGRVSKVHVTHESWVIVLDRWVTSNGQSSQVNTRVRALFEPTTPFKFKTYRENPVTRLAKHFGFKDTHTGDLLLDRDFIVRTDNESMMRSLAARAGLGQLLVNVPRGKLEITRFRGKRKPRPERAAELRWVSPGLCTDGDQIEGLFRLFERCLSVLHKIGAATHNPVAYDL